MDYNEIVNKFFDDLAKRTQEPKEIVTVAEASALPDGTRLVPCTKDGIPLVGHTIRWVQQGEIKMPVSAGDEWMVFLVFRA